MDKMLGNNNLNLYTRIKLLHGVKIMCFRILEFRILYIIIEKKVDVGDYYYFVEQWH